MKNKERATDIGTAERRVLQPQVARKMARMNATKKAEFEKGVHQEVERVVYAAKRRYVRRQEKLDEVGVFHPEANAHRCVRFPAHNVVLAVCSQTRRIDAGTTARSSSSESYRRRNQFSRYVHMYVYSTVVVPSVCSAHEEQPEDCVAIVNFYRN